MINSQYKFSTCHWIFALFAMIVFLIVKTILSGLKQTTVIIVDQYNMCPL